MAEVMLPTERYAFVDAEPNMDSRAEPVSVHSPAARWLALLAGVFAGFCAFAAPRARVNQTTRPSERYNVDLREDMGPFVAALAVQGSKSAAPPDPDHPDGGPMATPLLDSIRTPKDLKRINPEMLPNLAEELRWDTIRAVSAVGGHFASSLGVVELTVALHYVFDAPEDKIIWDVGHQAYPHKILTGRRERFNSLRKSGGIAGFPNMDESEYDAFGVGHSSTSISAAQGYDVAKQLLNKPVNNTIAVIGDGAITGGMAFEAMNTSAFFSTKQIIILNDNDQVSLPTGVPTAAGTKPVGMLSAYTQQLPNGAVKKIKQWAKELNKLMPEDLQALNKQIDDVATEKVFSHATLFEDLGFRYVGPMNGHDLPTLVRVLEELRDTERTKPVLLHVRTVKGKGYAPAESAPDRMHAVGPFDVNTGAPIAPKVKKEAPPPSFTSIMANELSAIAKDDEKVVAITAAMPGGTGLSIFGHQHPERFFDVGIAEQHAVTFAAGMAAEGIKPFCAIYSTFLQRAFDQVVHDVALQNLPVRFMVDRAGYVGNDGSTHHGTFDLSYLGAIPNLVIMAPSDEVELVNMVRTAHDHDAGPSVVRYPRGSGYGLKTLNSLFRYDLKELPSAGTVVPIGKGRVVRESVREATRKNKVAFLSLGTRLATALLAARELEAGDENLAVTVADARFMKPLDVGLIRELAESHSVIVTIEEGSIGGFGSHVLQFLALRGYLDGNLEVRPMVLPDRWIDHATQQEQYDTAGLSTGHVVTTVRRLRGQSVITDPSGMTARQVLDGSSSRAQGAAGL
jgi:1-deoxy-D-xylulose-5-phosphate synthase